MLGSDVIHLSALYHCCSFSVIVVAIAFVIVVGVISWVVINGQKLVLITEHLILRVRQEKIVIFVSSQIGILLNI